MSIRYTDRVRKVMKMSVKIAQRFNHEYIEPADILLAILKEGSGVAVTTLKHCGIDPHIVQQEIEKEVVKGPEMDTPGRLPQTPQAKKMIKYAIEEADTLKHTHVGTEHILLGIIRLENGIAPEVLKNLGLKLEEVRAQIQAIYAVDPSNPPHSKVSIIPPNDEESDFIRETVYRVTSIEMPSACLLIKVSRGGESRIFTVPATFLSIESIRDIDVATLVFVIREYEEFRIPLLRLALEGEIEKIIKIPPQ